MTTDADALVDMLEDTYCLSRFNDQAIRREADAAVLSVASFPEEQRTEAGLRYVAAHLGISADALILERLP